VIAALLAVALLRGACAGAPGWEGTRSVAGAVAVEPALSVSVGRVEGLRLSEDGACYEADYVPAGSAASAGRDPHGRGRQRRRLDRDVPLWAEGDAVVKTRPRGKISVRIGSEEFGPR